MSSPNEMRANVELKRFASLHFLLSRVINLAASVLVRQIY